MIGNREAAEDVVADAFLKVYERIRQFDERRAFGPWFYRIVVNGALKVIRSRRAGSFTREDIELLDRQADAAAGPEEEVAAREMRLLLLGAIYSLPAHQRVALVLKYYLDMNEAEIAQAMGCPLGTVKWRLYAAKQRLRRSLAPQPGASLIDFEI